MNAHLPLFLVDQKKAAMNLAHALSKGGHSQQEKRVLVNAWAEHCKSFIGKKK